MRGNQKNKNYKVKWSPEIAYAAGLIATDGNLSKDGRHIIFVSKDIRQVNNFKNCLCLDNDIKKKSSSYKKDGVYYYVRFSNVILYKWLRVIGLMPNKSKNINSLNIPDKYFFDFLRGHLDGDGCFYSFWDKRWKNSFMFYTVFIAHNKKHLEWLKGRIKKASDISGSISPGGRSVWQLRYAKGESKILIPKMYYKNNLPYLKRKRDKIKKILEIDRGASDEIGRHLCLRGIGD